MALVGAWIGVVALAVWLLGFAPKRWRGLLGATISVVVMSVLVFGVIVMWPLYGTGMDTVRARQLTELYSGFVAWSLRWAAAVAAVIIVGELGLWVRRARARRAL